MPIILCNAVKIQLQQVLAILQITPYYGNITIIISITGQHTCECLQLPPYNLTLDPETKQCRANDGARCFSPFGFHCLTGAVCRQTGNPSGECVCTRLPGNVKLKDNCSGYKEDYENPSTRKLEPAEPENAEQEEIELSGMHVLDGIRWLINNF